MLYVGKDNELLIKPKGNQNHDSCPKCDNRMGFSFGTCVECGFNHYDYDYKYIKVDIDFLPKEIRNFLIRKHDENINFRNRL